MLRASAHYVESQIGVHLGATLIACVTASLIQF